jgi:ribosome-associated toxin RatA of RatAB toxin-antitoxin module
VINVDDYKKFVPLVKDSRVIFKKDGKMEAELVIDYKAGETSYISNVEYLDSKMVKVSVKDNNWLFKHLNNLWEFK